MELIYWIFASLIYIVVLAIAVVAFVIGMFCIKDEDREEERMGTAEMENRYAREEIREIAELAEWKKERKREEGYEGEWNGKL